MTRSTPAADVSHSEVLSERLNAIVASGKLSSLRWPDFSNYRKYIQELYEPLGYTTVWIRNGQPTPQALGLIAALESSQLEGLNPDDYDASHWTTRLNTLRTAQGNADAVVSFDVALTVSAMRYISDLHIGRVNPKHFQFGIDIQQKKYNLPEFLSQEVLTASNIQTALDEAAPQYKGYRRTKAALQKYRMLAAQAGAMPLLKAAKTLAPGDAYADTARLAQRLRLTGDLPQDTIANADSGIYDTALTEAVRHFQLRHGLEADGKLGKQTLRQLNTPWKDRVIQLEDALERWRWLPPNFPQPPVTVNIPEFRLRAFSEKKTVALSMKVVVGKAVRHQTPVFAENMTYIVFRPYWNVPLSIARAEIIPALLKDRRYLERKHFEVVDWKDRHVTSGVVSDEVLAQLRSGKLRVRQKPGLENALGLVKFMFPNEYNVYLHGTPVPQLFAQSRRDFSHGCVRVEKPVELAVWLLRDQPPWTPGKIEAAMESGPDNQHVMLAKPVPVLIVYLTAVVEEDNQVYFFDDIYGHDRSLNAVLAKGRPYPK